MAERLGYNIINWYEDHGLTGTESTNRPKFQRLLQDAKNGTFEVVLLSEQSRMSREDIFDAMLHWWQMPSDPELTTFFAADRTPPAGRNINYFRDEELTRLLYASDRTVDRAARKALLERAQAIISEQVPEIPLYSVTRLDAVPATLAHFKGNPTNTGIFWNVHEWEIK